MASPSTDNNGFVLPPPTDQLIDKSTANEVVECLAIRCKRPHTQSIITRFNSKLFRMPQTQDVPWLYKFDSLPEPESLLILDPSVGTSNLDATEHAFLHEISATLETFQVQLDFEHRTTDWLLSHYLPHIPNITNSFEIVGHIAHVNLRGDEMLAAKYTIGAVLLGKNKDKGIRTVVNKVGHVDNEFRVLPMELLAGDTDTLVKVYESGCNFEFDFKDVFWNSRLQGEHARIVRLMKPSDVACDMFAGVGPFAIPLAKRGIRVYANDLNPKSYEWMVENAKKNLGKKKLELVTCTCLDGREFARDLIQTRGVQVTHVLMNLPKLAPEFCDVFVKLFPKGYALPRVHVYCFGSGTTPQEMEDAVLARIQLALGGVTLPRPDLQIFRVRQTSANTWEFCVSFTVPAQVAFVDD